MSKWQTIIETYTELTDNDFGRNGNIELHDEGDGVDFIARWDYSKPIPKGLKIGK